VVASGFYHLKGFARERIGDLVAAVEAVVAAAPWLSATTPGGQKMSVRITSCGLAGWWSDRAGYRYVRRHPETGAPYPAVPAPIAVVVRESLGAIGYERPYHLDACHMNLYRDGAKLGLHRDADEHDLAAPIVSISLGDSCEFVMGGPNRKDRVESLLLHSGDVVVLAGAARNCFHGVRRVFYGSDMLMPGTRINLTARQVWPTATPRPVEPVYVPPADGR